MGKDLTQPSVRVVPSRALNRRDFFTRFRLSHTLKVRHLPEGDAVGQHSSTNVEQPMMVHGGKVEAGG